MTYKFQNFAKFERLRIGVDGQTHTLRSGGVDDWIEFESSRLTMGIHSLDISVLSSPEKFDPNFVSKA